MYEPMVRAGDAKKNNFDLSQLTGISDKIGIFLVAVSIVALTIFTGIFYFEATGNAQVTSLTIRKTRDKTTNTSLSNGNIEFQNIDFVNYYFDNVTKTTNKSTCPRIVSKIVCDNNGICPIDTKSLVFQTCNSGLMSDSLIIQPDGTIRIKKSAFETSNFDNLTVSYLTVNSVSSLNGFTSINGVLTVTAPSGFTSNVNITGFTFLNDLRVSKTLIASGSAVFGNTFRAIGPSSFDSNLVVGGTFRAIGPSSFDGNLIVGGTFRAVGVSSFDNNLVVGGSLNVLFSVTSGLATLTFLTVSSTSTLSGDVNIGGTLRFNQNGIMFNGVTGLGVGGIPGVNVRTHYISGNVFGGLDLNHGNNQVNNQYFFTTNTSGLYGNPGLTQAIMPSGILGTQFFSINGYNIISTRSVKRNITNTTTESSVNRVMNIRIVDFEYEEQYRLMNNKEPGIRIGVLAEEVNKIYPFSVSNFTSPGDSSQSYRAVDYTSFTPDAIKVIQYHQNKLNEVIYKFNQLLLLLNLTSIPNL